MTMCDDDAAALVTSVSAAPLSAAAEKAEARRQKILAKGTERISGLMSSSRVEQGSRVVLSSTCDDLGFEKGSRVVLSSTCDDLDFLQRGQVGLVVGVGVSMSFHVEYGGSTHWYSASDLALAPTVKIKFAVEQLSAQIKQQLPLPNVIIEPSDATSAGTVSFQSSNTRVVKVDGSSITAVSAGISTLTATFRPSDGSEFLSSKSSIQMNVVKIPLSLTSKMAEDELLVVPLRAPLSLQSLSLPGVEPNVSGAWNFLSKSPNLGIKDGVSVCGLNVADSDSLTATFNPEESDVYEAVTAAIPVCVRFVQEEDDRNGNLGRVDDFFNNKGAFEGSHDIPFPDLDYSKLCPHYYQNITSALRDPPQVPVCAQETHLRQLIANACLPLECKLSKDNGGCQFPLNMYLRRAVEKLGEQQPSARDLSALEFWITSCKVDFKRRDSFLRTFLHSLAVSGTASSIAFADAIIRFTASLESHDADELDHHEDDLLAIKDSAGRDALEIAVDQGHVEFATMLIRNGANHAKDFLKNKYDPQSKSGRLVEKWMPVIDAVVHGEEALVDSDPQKFLGKYIKGDLPDFSDVHPLESDPEVLAILQNAFEPPCPPLLKNVASKDPAFAQLLRTVAFTRMPACCTPAEVQRNLSLYIKLLKGDPGEPVVDLADDDACSSYTETPVARSASGKSLHRWVLAIAAHLAHYQGKNAVAKSLLELLQQLSPNRQLSTTEQRLLASSSSSVRFVAKSDVLSQIFGKHDPLTDKFTIATKGWDAKQLEPLKSLMDLIGLSSIKEAGIEMYSMAKDRERLREAGKENSIVHSMLNFVFVGNPGCGKTESANLLAKILVQSKMRPSNYVGLKAQQAISMGSKEFAQMLLDSKIVTPPSADASMTAPVLAGKFLQNEVVEVKFDEAPGKFFKATIKELPGAPLHSADKYRVVLSDKRECDVALTDIRRFAVTQQHGGVIFIDEAQELDPSRNGEGRGIFNEIMRIAEDCRETVTIILAGYGSDIEQKLFAYNIGMYDRFRTMKFDDFTELELEHIWKKVCHDKGYKVDDRVSAIVRRRLSKQRGRQGFGNARAVRLLFERVQKSAEQRWSAADEQYKLHKGPKEPELEIIITDVIGEKPDRLSTHPEIDVILKEVDALIGLKEIKKAIYAVYDTMRANWDIEESAKSTVTPANLYFNRVFVGNPGTGKTTVAKLYARLLCATGMLSKDEVVEKTASDFISEAVGGSSQRTKEILKLAEGKALFIDEAYNLFDGSSQTSGGKVSYGSEVLATIVEKVQPPEDRAVIMAGYEEQLQAMFRGSNPGLTSRFDSDNPWRFADFSDAELMQVCTYLVSKPESDYHNLVDFEVRSHIVQKVAKQRVLHNFGNARAVGTALKNAKAQQTIRLTEAREGKPVSKSKRITIADVDGYTEEERKMMDNPMSTLDEFQSLGDFKSQMQKLQDSVKGLQAQGRPIASLLDNWMFLGNPGTGKTTVAQKMAKFMHSLGLLPTDRCVEVAALDLTGEFVGHSKKKVQEAMDAARGGVLFIDEAYNLGGHDKFCKDAQDTLVQLMTDTRYKGSTIVIIAGYKSKMEDMMQINEGFMGRFGSTQHFQDWSFDALSNLTVSMLLKGPPPDKPYALFDPEGIKAFLRGAFQKLRAHNPAAFSNARDADTMCKLVKKEYSSKCGKIVPFPPITVAEFEAATKAFLQNRPSKKVTPPPPLQNFSGGGVRGVRDAAGNEDGAGPELTADRFTSAVKRVLINKHKESDGDAPSLVSDESDGDLDFLKSHLKAIEDRLKSAESAGHESSLREERDRTIKMIKTIAELKRLHDVAAAQKKLEEEKRRLALMTKIREKICAIGRCPKDFAWRWEGNQFHCEGGLHYATPEQLGVDVQDCINFFSKTGVVDV